jgi:hypothetical protein
MRILTALLLIWLPEHLFAQSTAEIRGIVTDTSGAVLTGVTFTLTNEGTEDDGIGQRRTLQLSQPARRQLRTECRCKASASLPPRTCGSTQKTFDKSTS